MSDLNASPDLNAYAVRTAPRLQQKKFNRIIALILAFVIVMGATALLISLLKQRSGLGPPQNGGTGNNNDAETGEVLPQNIRDSANADEAIWFARDPFAAPLKLTGVISGGWGDPIAIIESGSAAYIVSVGDIINEVWTVAQIVKDTVVLKAADREVKLQLKHRPIEEMGVDSSESDGGEGDS
ncbi:MAG: hypothetical protein AB1767_10690 [Bacillota bacterium]